MFTRLCSHFLSQFIMLECNFHFQSTSSQSLNVDNKTTSSVILDILKANRPEWLYIALGCVFSVIAGANAPIYALVYGDFIGVTHLHFFNFDIFLTNYFPGAFYRRQRSVKNANKHIMFVLLTHSEFHSSRDVPTG